MAGFQRRSWNATKVGLNSTCRLHRVVGCSGGFLVPSGAPESARTCSAGCVVVAQRDIEQSALCQLGTTDIAALERTVLKLDGAAQANRSEGAFSAFIRTYRTRQAEHRSATGYDLQAASNRVASNVFDQAFGTVSGFTLGQVPTIGEIVDKDGAVVAAVVFEPPTRRGCHRSQSRERGLGRRSLVLASESEQTHLLIGIDGQTNTLNDLRNAIFALDTIYGEDSAKVETVRFS